MDSVGQVELVRAEICIVRGFQSIGLGNVVAFSSGARGLVLGFSHGSAEVAMLHNSTRVKKGDLVRVVAERLTISVGTDLLGRVIDPLGGALDGKGAVEILGGDSYPVESIARPVHQRALVKKPFRTGYITIDSQIPLGLGQRELLLGEKQSGQNDLAIDIICNQTRLSTGLICIYVAIDADAAAVKRRIQRLEDQGALAQSVVIVGRTSEAASLNYIAPMVGTTIAEWLSSQGRDVLIVFDDLTRHAKVYRQMSLLLERPASREAYPGDIFYLHSRLLERCGAFDASVGGGTITALPVVETQSEDATDYITTNLMSITDGHVLFRQSLANEGHQPPIDSGFSVSRIGSQAQVLLMRKLSERVREILIGYEEIAKFTSFGADLPSSSLELFNLGRYTHKAFQQDHDTYYSTIEQCLLMRIVTSKRILRWSEEQIENVVEALLSFVRKEPYRNMLNDSVLSMPYEHAIVVLDECLSDFTKDPLAPKPEEKRERLVAEVETINSLLQEDSQEIER